MRRLRFWSTVAIGLATLTLGSSLTGCKKDRVEEPPQERVEAPPPKPQTPPPSRTDRLGAVPDGMVRAVSYYPTGEFSTSALRVVKLMPEETRVGSPFDYAIEVTNLTSVELDNVVVTDEPTSNLNVTGSTPNFSTSGSTLIWELGQLGPRGDRTIRAEAVATSADAAGSCTTATYNTTLCLATRVVDPQLQIAKTATPTATPCDEIEYRYTVTNTGTGTIAGASFRDTLAPGITTSGGNSVINNPVDPLGPGESRTYLARVQAGRTGSFGSSATVTAGNLSATSGTPDTVVTQPVLDIEVTCAADRYLGAPATFNITVTNTGDAPAVNTNLTSTIPGSSQFVDATDGGGLAGGNVGWNLGTIAPGEQNARTVSFRVSPSRIGALTTNATASAVCATNVSDSCTTDIRGIPAVLLEVVDRNDPVLVGERTTYVITVTNQGSQVDRNIDIEATLPPGSTFIEATGPNGNRLNIQPVNRVLDFPILPELRPGTPPPAAQWTVTVQADAVGDVRFRVEMRTEALDEDSEKVFETEATRFYQFDN